MTTDYRRNEISEDYVMATEVRLPQLGETMEEGTIVGCMVKVDDEVKKGDVIFEIETDKAALEMESPAGGFVKRIIAEVNQTLPVGEVLLVVGDKDEEVSQDYIDSLKESKADDRRSVSDVQAVEIEPEITLFGRADTEPEQVDVEIKLGAKVPLTRRQKQIAKQMVKSKRDIPCFYLTSKVDVTELAKLKAELSTGDTDISYDDFIIKALGTALAKFPIMTGQIEGSSIKLAEAINIGFAVAAPKGVVVPVVKDADKKDVGQIAQETRRLTEKAQNEKLIAEELEGACITISNPSEQGIDTFIPIVVPGQCSGLGMGRIIEACVPAHGDTNVRKQMKLSISVDHKIANGDYAARFLDTVKKLLEDVATFT
jgi:pyruvate dehydrogenase E2 component (dihydrolipoamide acetyltransferase)